ncbi:hypothetical protein HNP36_000453 [Chryseobacterium shigense]|uniref:Uncharacterized protein n=1 Tax=Chryseobacterium shigense TaxID=297244 RepID=A0A841N7G1_9FLAO|nr:hypothetical protein [Chryseobacterium shigense]
MEFIYVYYPQNASYISFIRSFKLKKKASITEGFPVIKELFFYEFACIF